MRLRAFGVKVLVLLTSLSVGVIAFELLGRLILNPADYLAATTVSDPILGMTITPNASGFDEWGFRNPAVPTAVDIVAIGDSHTYGNTVKMQEAWPQVVARETGSTVYNMGLGGYGPNQYYQLLQTRGLSLHPKQVLVGLYLGDDFENAFSITYGLDYWTSLREGTRAPVNADIWGDAEAPGRLKSVRNWLSRHSLAYRLIVHGPALAALKAKVQFRQVSRSSDPSVTVIEVPENQIHEAFRPLRVAAGLDQTRAEVREGMRLTFHLLTEMNRTCQTHGCSLKAVIIPSKETVFADYLRRATDLHLKTVVESLIQNERLATAALEEFLASAGIPYVATLPALRKEVTNQLYYRGPADMHPNANGQRVIGKAVAEFLRATPSLAAKH